MLGPWQQLRLLRTIAVRAVIQRVQQASVQVDGDVIGQTGPGVLVLLGVTHSDGPEQVAWLAKKVAGLRIFADDEGKTNRSLTDDGLGALVISQFTLYADTRKGRRPGFSNAARPDLAQPLYESFCAALTEHGVPVERGQFGADMKVSLVNDGPFTLVVDTP